MKKLKLTKILLSCLLLTGCTYSKENMEPTRAYSNISLDCGFDTFFSLKEYTNNKEDFDTHFLESTELFKTCNELFDIYNSYEGVNNLKTVNDNAGIKPVVVDPLIIEMLDEAKMFYELSDGEFDITMGNLLHLWHTYREQGIHLNQEGKKGHIPSDEELDEAFSHRGFDHLLIDHENSTVYIDDPAISLDVGGIAKGFAAEKVAEYLEAQGVKDGTNINAGGNNRTIGNKPDGTPWKIGIQNPGNEGSILAVSCDGSISSVTSGDYERFYIAENNQRYHHIIDPQTKYPSTYFRSVTIFTKNSSDADCLSTTLYTMSYEDGVKLLDAYNKKNPDHTANAVWISDLNKAPNTTYGKQVGEYFISYSEGLESSILWR